MTIFTKAFARYALERAIKTLVQTLIAGIGTVAAFGEVPWIAVLSAAAMATIVSILTSAAVYTGGDTMPADQTEPAEPWRE